MARSTPAEAAATAARILRVAQAHIAALGYSTTSVEEIAREAGVTRGAVYHHFASKHGLFAAIAADLHREVAGAVVAAADQTASPSEALRAGSHAFIDAIGAGPAARVLLVEAPAVLGWREWRRMDAEGSGAHLREALADARIDRSLVDAMAQLLSGAMNDVALWLAERPDDVAARREAHAALDRLLDAVAPG